MLSIPLNFIVLNGVGNLYISTTLLFINFFLLLFLTDANILKKPNTLLALGFGLFFIFTTIVNIFFDNQEIIKMQSVYIILYLQNILAFIIFYYFFDRISLDFFLKLFLLIIVLSVFRIFIEEPNHIFSFSTIKGERIEAYFISGVNNFAIFIGVALIISFFYIKKRFLKLILCLFWLLVITLTLSRGALLGVIVTLFAVAFYDTDRKTLKALTKFTIFLLLVGVFAIFYFDKVEVLVEQFNDRFLSFFTGEKSIETFSSGRIDVWGNMIERIGNSNFSQILFGHGVGSINFVILGELDFESSHNVFIDLAYRNGIIVCILYLMMVVHLFWLFIKNRNRNKLTLFGIFFFIHLELMVNPMLFAAQTGWIYAMMLVMFIKQNKLTSE